MFIVDKLVIYVFKFEIILLPHFIIVIVVGKTSKMNSLYYGMLRTFFDKFHNFYRNDFILYGWWRISGSAILRGDSFSPSLSPLVIYQFYIPIFSNIIPLKVLHIWFSSFTIYYNCAVVVTVVVRFLLLTRVVPLVLILSFIIISGKSSPKRNSDSEGSFHGMTW